MEDIFVDTEKQIFDIIQQNTSGEYVPIKDVVLNALDKIEMASRTKGNVTGIPTGFIDLDYKTTVCSLWNPVWIPSLSEPVILPMKTGAS